MQVQIDEEAELMVAVGEKEEEKFGTIIKTMDAHHSICNNAAPSWTSSISVFIFHFLFLCCYIVS
jgi:hypothetical protein